MIKNVPAMQDPRFDPWVGKISWRREWQPTPIFFLGESYGQRSWMSYSSLSCKESDTAEATECTHVILLPKSLLFWVCFYKTFLSLVFPIWRSSSCICNSGLVMLNSLTFCFIYKAFDFSIKPE